MCFTNWPQVVIIYFYIPPSHSLGEIWSKSMNLFKSIGEVRAEIEKVTWPTRNETITLTIIVVIISFIVGIYLGVLDLLFTKMLEFLIS